MEVVSPLPRLFFQARDWLLARVRRFRGLVFPIPTLPAKEVLPVFVNTLVASSRAMFVVSERSVDEIVMLVDPSNETPAMVRGFFRVVAVSELPVRLPVTFPVRLPVVSPVMLPVRCPMNSAAVTVVPEKVEFVIVALLIRGSYSFPVLIVGLFKIPSSVMLSDALLMELMTES
jgi:hypothetical protein